jgi:YD repeat-containing protein
VLLPGGATKSYVYDPLMRVKEIAAQDKDSNGIVSYAYDYDRMDNIMNKNTEHGNYDYIYDALYRLTDVDNPAIDDEGFGYDPVGNRLTSTTVAGTWT